jgi:hypothetical protein
VEKGGNPVFSRSVFVCAVCALALVVPSASFAQIATGASSAVDGYLRVSPDAYGSWASTTFGGGGDIFNPSGAAAAGESAFSAGFLLFVGTTQRQLLTANATYLSVGDDATLAIAVTSPNAFSDTNGDTINDRAVSAFSVLGGTTDLGVSLVQQVGSGGPGVAFLQQDYTLTNNSEGFPISFKMVRNYDGDLPWTGGANFFLDDEVGTSMHGAGQGTYVFQQEPSLPGTTAVTLSGSTSGPYYGGKNGVIPGGAGTAYGFGTDVQVWNAFGVPTNWQNHVAGVGYNANGVSGSTPPGSDPTSDAFIGLAFDVAQLGPGESTTVTVIHTFGQGVPIPEPASLMLLAIGAACLRRRR